MGSQEQRERAAGNIAAVSAAATVMFAVLPHVGGVPRYVFGITGVSLLLGVAFLSLSQWQS